MLYGFMFKEPSTMLSIIFTVGFVMQFLAIVTSFSVLIFNTQRFDFLSPDFFNHFSNGWLSNFSAILMEPSYILPGLLSGAMILGLLTLHFAFTGRFLEENLSKMLGEGDSHIGQYSLKLAFQERIARLLYKNKQDQAFFILGYSISSNDRKIKQTIYPLYVSMLIFTLYFAALLAYFSGLKNLPSLAFIMFFTIFMTFVTLKTEKIDWPFSYDLTFAESKKGTFILVNLACTLVFVALHVMANIY